MKQFLNLKYLPTLVVNLIPLYGVVFLGWSPLIIILLYVSETILVGIIHMLRMTVLHYSNRHRPEALAVKRHDSGIKGMGLVLFFMVHYGFFIFVQMMVFTGFVKGQGFLQAVQVLFTGDYKYALMIIFFTNLSAWLYEFLWDPAVHLKLPEDVFMDPYPRILVQQFMVILGGWVSVFGGKMTGYLVVLILAKLFAEILFIPGNISVLKNWKSSGHSGDHS